MPPAVCTVAYSIRRGGRAPQPVPLPPSHYTHYTSHNLDLLRLLRTREGADADLASVNQREVLSDQSDVPEWPLAQLEPPRVDWILDEGHYSVFGDTWFVKETIPSLAELGGHQLYPADPSIDRRPALRAILRSLLVTYSHLLNALLAPPPTPASAAPPEWQRHVEWITVLAQNVMAAANDLRPVQARGNLELDAEAAGAPEGGNEDDSREMRRPRGEVGGDALDVPGTDHAFPPVLPFSC
ncbi:Mediator of RNA polymerase II transcription subunit 7 [Grifola frondosa]|uniref:Mediator of RNA polymerase II transcription subunit 7 n=1 Tax=Grifola frondosa TaxID=5627 RepID=A0A1C7MH56_GRIFR|nr:Mediator of RNA polymerase II transcription subunit 7 [Grifola frondosa]